MHPSVASPSVPESHFQSTTTMAPTNSLAFISASGFAPIIHSGLRQSPVRLPHSISRATFSVNKRRFQTANAPRFCATALSKVSSSDSSISNPSATSPSSNPSLENNVTTTTNHVLTFQEAIQRLSAYWASKGCLIWHPYNVEVGAGTMNPATFLRVLGPEPWAVAYDEPSIRPDDSRYGENPNRLQRHTQFQVIMKPAGECTQELVVGSYKALGIDTCKNDVRFVEDNWESPALGAWGLGWEIWLNGMEVTQFTYFQQAGGITLDSVSVEITYGLERIIMALQGKSHFKDIIYAPGITYGDIFMQNEIEMSQYNMDNADIKNNKEMFQIYENEALQLLKNRLPVPAYNYVLKASHTFNILDARGAIGVTERARYFQRMRNLSRDVAKLWLAKREELEFPLLPKEKTSLSDPNQSSHNSGAASLGSTADLVLEIGIEELPAGDVLSLINQVNDLLKTVLQESRLQCTSVQVDGTPRRVVAIVKDLQTRQSDETKRVRGPPLSVAVKDGEMTKAAKGFMRSQKVDESAVEMDESEGYMYATVEEIGRTANDVLSEMIPSNILERISFGKSMRWNETGISFSRPLRWLLCLLDDVIIPFEYAGVKSSNITRSLRRANGFADDVVIKKAEECEVTLSNLQIVLSREERRKIISKKAVELATQVGGIIPDEYLNGELMEEIVDLVENPIPLIGSYDELFLELPKEVLESVMKKHQRYLPIMKITDNINGEGKLLNKFITVANGDANEVDIDLICEGNEAVLRARYSDAAFFYENDTKDKKLEDFIPQLSGITFQEKLGSILDKKDRVVSCMGPLGELLSLSKNEIENSKKVANLFKADLATSMVIEMTSLAGIIGKHYTEKSQEASSEVSNAIFEANLPRFSGDNVAQSKQGAVVAIADRVDSLVGLFSVGLVPKSSADPFALRRAALGIIQTLVACRFDVDLSDLIKISANSIEEQIGEGTVKQDTQIAVLDFVAKRLEGYLLDNFGFPDDIVKSVLAISRNANNPLSAIAACKVLQEMIEADKGMVNIAQEAHSRAARLIGSLKDISMEELLQTEIQEALFECDEERALSAALNRTEKELSNTSAATEDQLLSRLECLVRMKSDIDAYFDGVFVNAEDLNVRKNRLALSAKIVSVTHNIVDLSLLVIV